MISENIVMVAMSFVGQTEKSGNKGWVDPKFEAKMKEVGWQVGHAWCAYQAELIWKEAYGKKHPLWKSLDKLFSPSATATYGNFHGSGLFKTGNVPGVGALAVWRYGTGWTGHIGVVTHVDKKARTFLCVEGNTNKAGEREGLMTLVKTRKFDMTGSKTGLNIIGYVYPNEQ
jgi:hypothetical protein